MDDRWVYLEVWRERRSVCVCDSEETVDWSVLKRSQRWRPETETAEEEQELHYIPLEYADWQSVCFHYDGTELTAANSHQNWFNTWCHQRHTFLKSALKEHSTKFNYLLLGMSFTSLLILVYQCNIIFVCHQFVQQCVTATLLGKAC